METNKKVRRQKLRRLLCTSCFPGGVEVATVWYVTTGTLSVANLCVHEGKAFLISENGHRGDVILEFPRLPTPDPDPECVKEDDGGWCDRVVAWTDGFKTDVGTGHQIIQGCLAAGWSRQGQYHGDALLWLYDHCGKLLSRKTRR